MLKQTTSVLAASAARVKAVHLFNIQDDLPWTFANAMIWSVLENHIAIIVACAPSVKVIALLIFPRLTSSLGKAVSRVTPSSSRSRSRASVPFGIDDLESGTRRSDKLRPTPISTPLPSPALTAESGASRASRNFARWFRGPGSPLSPRHHLTSGDSLEDTGLVYVEDMQPSKNNVHLVEIQKEFDGGDGDGNKRDSGRTMSPTTDRENDIRVEHTISVESGSRHSSEDGIEVVGRAV